MPQMSKVELYAAIRRDHRAGMKMRELERKYNVSWRTVKKAVDSVWPEPRKKLPPRPTALDPYKPVIDEMLRTDLDAPRKQRHTITRIFHRLIEEHGADVSYQMVRRYVSDRKPEILAASGKAPIEAFVPQTHLPGHEAEVDFGDVTVRLAGELVTCYLFSLRLSYSGKAVHRVFASCGQEAFFEGHVHALRTLGGVPRSKIRYDNLKSAVAQVLGLNRARVETDRWIAFRSHFNIESFYCRPGIEGAHEKGGVEGMIGYFRRNHFTPVPEVDFLAELLMTECDDRARRRSERRIKAAGFPREKSLRAFDFDANPNIDAATVHTLASCEWIKKSQPLCLIGDSGTGKSHMLIALGTEAAMKGYRVRYTLATKLVNELVEAADEKQLNKTIARYGRVDLLCIDELGYMELDRRGAELLFQVLTEREEKNSVAIASNESFGGWTKTFTDPRLCAAIVDRLTFNGTIIETGTDSYRLASTRARAEHAEAG
ncbi:IS21-like element helper ATPase IstB [Streptomyces uncialis]|uniref:IS21-like element helper ATPase IstB n=2 Tax=Streptomyces TaxID=1883 RepID=UPI00365258C5